jgi:predicted nucleotidyltransferase
MLATRQYDGRWRVTQATDLELERVGRIVEEIFPEVLGVWVYGSMADGTANEASDIDIAILGEAPIPLGWNELERIGELSGRLARDVDLIDLRAVSALLRFEVVIRDVRVAARDPLACDRYETQVISAYQMFYAEQLPRFRDIRERGRVF